MAEPRGDAALILALARGATVRDAAREARLSERSAYRRLAEPDFRHQLGRARCDLLAQAVGTLAEQATDAARTLGGLLRSDSDSIKLRAAVAILDAALKGVDQTDVADRVVALEEALAHNLFDAQTEQSWRK